jgi:16S rRNA (uracil1498-N3)-methyltransferase
MRLMRCFVPPPLHEHTQRLLPRTAALHVARVLRLRPGATLRLFDGRGGEFEAEIVSIQRDQVQVALHAHRPIERETPLRISLLQSLARGERMDFIVQKATELGVAEFSPIATEHSVVRLEQAAATRRREHWLQIAISACEQCGRNRIPAVHEVTDLSHATGHAGGGARWILSPKAELSLADAIRRAVANEKRLGERDQGRNSVASGAASDITLLIGPEGGFSEAELDLAHRMDFQPCHLGPRILRAETAPVAALTIVQALMGDLR